ncbi:3'-5' exonuclease [uncultured Desulfovibrio sp.]|uniref:3'-5' exonuclease n=1 Tax=uncultured Desulfovibrio sp. TaxID=167968 RepID=UPI00263352C4|nr:3'-5' exonuclease [uncultured Desulfovibrio sp.]
MNLESLRRHLSSDEINALPLCHYEGPIHLVRSLEDWEQALPDLRRETVLGFDTETRPSFRKGRVNAPSLVQLATASAVYLIQLSWWPFGEELASLLADPGIIKAGVAIGDDMRELARLHPFTPAGTVDLGQLARSYRLTTQGLRTLAANLFGQRISKGPQCSNWSVPELSRRQVIYAATDAWIGRAIYLRMRELGMTAGAAA